MTQPFVPLMKHMPNMTVKTTAAARLPVAWNINSVIGMLVLVWSTTDASPRQKRITRIKTVPLLNSLADPKQRRRNSSYVTPPTPIAYNIARGTSFAGCGISSAICDAASNPIKDSADCSRPSIHDTPSLHPVSLLNSVKTNFALFFGAVARIVIDITTTARIDQ